MRIRIDKGGTFKSVVTRHIVLRGLTDVMFDRYPGDNRTALEPWQKLYLDPKDRAICLPSLNLTSALSAENTNSWPRILMDPRKYKGFARACLSYTTISPTLIPFVRDGKRILLGSNLAGDIDEATGCYIHRTVARLEKGIPNPKARPVLPLPWSLEFDLTIYPNSAFNEQELRNIIAHCGIALGIGTFRGAFGKFEVAGWD